MFDIGLFSDLLSYAPFQPATNFWRAIEVKAVVDHSLPAGRGLDLGCGDGRLTGIILSKIGSREFVGVDLDPLETALAIKSGLYTAIHTTSATSIPEPSASFDFVLSNSVLEHIPDIDGVLAEVGRLLRPGGRFILTVPSSTFHDCLRGPSDVAARLNYLGDIDQRCAHLRYWDLSTWKQHLSPHGLDINFSREYLSQAEVRRWEALSNNTGGLLYKLYGKREQPIDIQRRFGLRKNSIRLPLFAARGLARLLSSGVRQENSVSRPFGCLLVEATRRS